jgi:hypothetical protein
VAAGQPAPAALTSRETSLAGSFGDKGAPFANAPPSAAPAAAPAHFELLPSALDGGGGVGGVGGFGGALLPPVPAATPPAPPPLSRAAACEDDGLAWMRSSARAPPPPPGMEAKAAEVQQDVAKALRGLFL